MRCKKCGSEKMGVMPNKKNPAATDLYCLECGAWQKFATRDEIRLYQTRKFIITNADRIRAMSDEEMAEWVTSGGNCVMTICDHICGGKCSAIKTFKKSSEEACKEIVMKWLQQPAEEDDNA